MPETVRERHPVLPLAFIGIFVAMLVRKRRVQDEVDDYLPGTMLRSLIEAIFPALVLGILTGVVRFTWRSPSLPRLRCLRRRPTRRATRCPPSQSPRWPGSPPRRHQLLASRPSRCRPCRRRTRAKPPISTALAAEAARFEHPGQSEQPPAEQV